MAELGNWGFHFTPSVPHDTITLIATTLDCTGEEADYICSTTFRCKHCHHMELFHRFDGPINCVIDGCECPD